MEYFYYMQILRKWLRIIAILIVIGLAAYLFFLCNEDKKYKPAEYDFKVIVIDSCEYLYKSGWTLTHKENCKYCVNVLK